jgi:ABC-2 type transport system permease protein
MTLRTEADPIADGHPPQGTGRAWLLVARREIVVKLTDRTFLVGTALTLVIIIATFAVQAFLAARTRSYDVAAAPAAATMARAVASAAPGIDENVHVVVHEVGDDDAARAALVAGSADAWLHPADGGWDLTTKAEPEAALRAVAAEVVRAEALRTNAAALGTTPEALQRGASLRSTLLDGDTDRADLVMGVGFAFTVLFYMATIMFGMTLATSVVTEKQSRIVEIIATAIPVRHLLAGKVLGNTTLAVAQLVVYLGAGLTGLAFTKYSSLVTGLSAPFVWFVVFFLAGFVALACLWAVAGSLAERNEDLQSTTTPLTMLLVGVLFGGMFLEGTWKTAGSFVPPLSAVLMPTRLLEGEAAWWEALISLALLLGAAAVAIGAGERLYRRSLLRTGGRVTWRQAWRSED